jgi:hypothetical protein
LASEHLQEIESLSGPERRKQETVIQETLGSLFDGEKLFITNNAQKKG